MPCCEFFDLQSIEYQTSIFPEGNLFVLIVSFPYLFHFLSFPILQFPIVFSPLFLPFHFLSLHILLSDLLFPVPFHSFLFLSLPYPLLIPSFHTPPHTPPLIPTLLLLLILLLTLLFYTLSGPAVMSVEAGGINGWWKYAHAPFGMETFGYAHTCTNTRMQFFHFFTPVLFIFLFTLPSLSSSTIRSLFNYIHFFLFSLFF